MTCAIDLEIFDFGSTGFGTTLFGSGSSPYLDNNDELELMEIIKSTIPKWGFQDCPQELWYSMVKQWALIKRNKVDQDVAKTYILEATGIWLEQHARDRATYRQPFEDDVALRDRLRNVQDAVTVNSIIWDNSLGIFDAYAGATPYTATYVIDFIDRYGNKYIVGSLTYNATQLSDPGTPKYLYFRSLGAGLADTGGTYRLWITSHSLGGQTGLSGICDAIQAYGEPSGNGVGKIVGNKLNEGFVLTDTNDGIIPGFPDFSVGYITPDLGIVKKLLNNGDGYGPFNTDYNYPGIVELPIDGLFLDDGFIGRGERYWGYNNYGYEKINDSYVKKEGNVRTTNGIVIILPYKADEVYPPPIADSIKQAVENSKAAGTSVFVECDNGLLPIIY